MTFRNLILCSFLASLTACKSTDDDTEPGPFVQTHPYVALTESARAHIDVQRTLAGGESILSFIETEADAEFEEVASDTWDAGIYGDHAFIAETNAFLVWYTRDCSRAARVVEAVEQLGTNWDDQSSWGINIRMPSPLMHFATAWDFMVASDCDYGEAPEQLANKIVEITSAFYEKYVLDPFYREASIGLTQNNHPIRTAAAIGMVGLVFEKHHEDATDWLNWAVSELDYLWGPDGQYVQVGGAVNEGPHYYGYGFAPTVAFFMALHSGSDPGRIYERNCINRSDLDPWAGHGCVDNEPFVFINPLGQERFWETVDWSISLRLPNGRRVPIGDAPLKSQVAAAILPAFGAPNYFSWDWTSNPEEPFKIKGYHRLPIQHLAHADASGAHEPPAWLHWISPESGVATFRTGWTAEDFVLTILAESGSARKAVHNHVDSTSFVFAGLNEIFITDTGYYKPNEQDNAVTAQAAAHNVVLINGKGAPNKGLLTNWGDEDAYLQNALIDPDAGYIEAVQNYEDHDVRRLVALLRKQYAVVGDFLNPQVPSQYEYRRRLHAFAGDDLEGETLIQSATVFDIIRPSATLRVYSESTLPEFALELPVFQEGRAPHVHTLIKGEGHHDVYDGVVSGEGPGFLSVLAPSKLGGTPLEVSSLTSGAGAVAFRVKGSGFDDVVLLNKSGGTDFDLEGVGRLETDADFVWLGLTDRSRIQRGGTYLRYEGEDLTCQASVSESALCTD